MADVREVAVRLKALNDDYKRGMAEAGDATSQFGKAAAAGVAVAGAAIVGLALNAANETVDYGKSIMKLSRITGDSVESMSKLNFAAQQSGVSSDQLANGMKFLEKNMAAGNAEFGKLGVNVTDSNGKLRGSRAVFLDVADSISHMSNGAEKTAAILKIFGRAGLDLGPMLNRGRQGIIDLENEAQKYGLVLSQDNVAAIQANIVAHRQFDAAMQGVKIQLGEQVLPALTKVTEAFTALTGPVAQTLMPLGAFVVGLGAVAVVGPKVKAGFVAATEGVTLFEAATAATVVGGMAVILLHLRNVQEESKRTQEALASSSNIDWADYTKAAAGINAQIAAVNKLGEAWERKGKLEQVWGTLTGERRSVADTTAQEDENLKHLEAVAVRTKELAGQLGITTQRAQSLATAVHVDLTQIDPAKYTPVFRAINAGTISAADGTRQLTVLQQQQGDSFEDSAKKIEEHHKAVKADNDAAKNAVNPQLELMAATQKVADARRGITDAERGVTSARRAAADAADSVVAAESRAADASRKVKDAIINEREAQQRLNDLRRGLSANEADDIEAAKISLIDAQRRAKGIKTDDPALEARKNALEVRRAQRGVLDATFAHAKAIAAAEKDVVTAHEGVLAADDAEKKSHQDVIKAQEGVRDAADKVRDAEQKLVDATPVLIKALLDQDEKARNLNGAFATQETSVDKSTAALQRWVAQGLITQDQADQLTQKMKDVKAAADLLTAPTVDNRPIQGPPMPGHTITGEPIPDNRPIQGPPLPVDNRPIQGPPLPHAAGGMLGEGWNLLGEQGPELALKRGGLVSVATASQTRGMLVPHIATAAANAPMAAGAGGYAHHGDLIVMGNMTERTARDLAWEQRRLALTMPGR